MESTRVNFIINDHNGVIIKVMRIILYNVKYLHKHGTKASSFKDEDCGIVVNGPMREVFSFFE